MAEIDNDSEDCEDCKDLASTPVERELTPEETAVVTELYRRKANFFNGEPTHAYVTTALELTMSKWNGIHPPEGKNMVATVIPPGTTLKIVMVSRFGDCGLTANLAADHGYDIRLPFESLQITDIRWNP